MKVRTIKEAWEEANKIFPYDYKKDEFSSENAGYPIYRSTALDHPVNWISDLGTRLEVNTEDGKTVYIWIEEELNESKDFKFTATVTYKVHDGSIMTKEIKGVEKIERTWERIGDKNVQVLRVYEGSFNWYTWAAKGVLKIDLVEER